ncbi:MULTISPECIES: hypothetical protein [Brevibacillus]|uniref:hypothetical protein n=1 Tax=Brevibacillus TaxID=55080 RepID=UPI000D0FF10B|nr:MULTISPECIES: hypothetical protein [Brevibacillus]MDN4094374.1 hypothetical protein [Brevibacillus agri]PSJ67470.1 hypothetical protein C7J99_20985 [Brevibacillus brevis]RED28459.1 hypothetical protein DES34_108326 [Brevibacillus brevis]VEF91154.1 Uncharacterised protein [Brevibacillus brevis]GEC90713.1 hypothetical protein BBR01nite_30440 [Brevibacillus brevis]
MKFYFHPEKGKLLKAHKAWAAKEILEALGWIDLFGEKNYAGQLYSILRLYNEDKCLYESKTVSTKNKEMKLILKGWESMKPIGTNDVSEEFLETLSKEELLLTAGGVAI